MPKDSERLKKKAKELFDNPQAESTPRTWEELEEFVEQFKAQKKALEKQQQKLKKANRELELRNQQLDDVFEFAPIAYFILNTSGEIIRLNQKAAQILRKPRESLMANMLSWHIHDGDQDRFYFHLRNVLNKKQSASTEVRLGEKNNNQGYFLLNSLPYLETENNKWQVRISATDISPVKEADLLKDSERRYRMLFRNMINGLLVLKPVFRSEKVDDFLFFRANAAFEKITGLGTKNLEGATLQQLFPSIHSQVFQLLQKTVICYTQQNLESILIKSATYVNIYAFVPEKGYVALILEDVTGRTQAEKEQLKSREMLKTIFKILPVGVTITDMKGDIIDCNKASEELLNLRKEEHLVRNFAGEEWQIIRKDLTPMPPEEFASVIALKENRIVENTEMGIVKGKDIVTWLNVSAAPIPLPDLGVAIVYSDITDRVKAQEETEQKFKNIVQNSTDAIIIINQQGSIIEWNKGCELIFGFRREAILEQKIWTFLESIKSDNSTFAPEEIISKEALLKTLKTGKNPWLNRITDATIITATGEKKSIQSVMFPVKSVDGYLIGVVARDISEVKKAENMLKVAKEKAEEASQAKSHFLANISHEIRTPLNAILGFTEILKEYPVTDQKFKSHLSGIEKSSKALMSLINDILDLSRMEAGKMNIKPTPLKIRSLVNDVQQIFSLKAENKNLAIKTVLPSNLPKVISMDEVRLRQVLFNLVGNAVKFTSQGSISIEAYAKNVSADKTDLTFKVADTGPGIAPEHIPSIFDPFYQKTPKGVGKQEGTGLGLAISKRFVEMMNGNIQVSSKQGQGTVFYVFIPEVPVIQSSAEKNKPDTQDPREESADLIFPGNKELVRLIHSEIMKKTGSEEAATKFMAEQIWSEYDKVADILGFDEVESFSTALLHLARQKKLEHLERFALKLQREAKSFNVIEINSMFSCFETLRN